MPGAQFEGWFIPDISTKEVAKSFFNRIARRVFSKIKKDASRYIILTPSSFRRQVVYDKKNQRKIPIKIRNTIDFFTLQQVYSSHDFGTEKLKRHNDIKAYYDRIVRQSSTPLIIDCGGNIGLASKFFSDEYESAQIVCIEPNSNNIKQARENNNSTNIEFIEAAIGSQKGSCKIIDPGLGDNAYRVQATEEGDTKVISINCLLEKYPPPRYTPFILKIDIEGFESDLFAANTEWIEKFPLIIIELHDWMLPKTANSKNFLQKISAHERDFVYYGEHVFSICNHSL